MAKVLYHVSSRVHGPRIFEYDNFLFIVNNCIAIFYVFILSISRSIKLNMDKCNVYSNELHCLDTDMTRTKTFIMLGRLSSSEPIRQLIVRLFSYQYNVFCCCTQVSGGYNSKHDFIKSL